MSSPLRVATGRPVVVDTSVAFKWFDTSEPGAEAAGELLDAHARDEVALVVPGHLPLELANALACRGASAEQVAQAVHDLVEADLLVATLDEPLLVEAAGIAFDDGLTLYDAVFAALAAALDAELVTADERQAQTRACRVRLVGV